MGSHVQERQYRSRWRWDLVFRLLSLLMTNLSCSSFVDLPTVYDLILVVEYRNDVNEEDHYP